MSTGVGSFSFIVVGHSFRGPFQLGNPCLSEIHFCNFSLCVSVLSGTPIIWMLNFLDWLPSFIFYPLIPSLLSFLFCFLGNLFNVSSNLSTVFFSLFSKLLLGHWIFFLIMSFSFFMYVIFPVLPYLMSLYPYFLSVWKALCSHTCMAYSLNSFRSLAPMIIYLKLLYSPTSIPIPAHPKSFLSFLCIIIIWYTVYFTFYWFSPH